MSDSCGSEIKIDLDALGATFFEEAEEHLSDLESTLVELEGAPGDAELLGRAFRAAHSIKGSAGLFGFTDLGHLTHALESLLDRMRSRTMTLDHAIAGLLLRAVDVLRDLLLAARASAPPPESMGPVLGDLEAALHGPVAELRWSAPSPEGAPERAPPAPVSAAAPVLDPGKRVYEVEFAPGPDAFMEGMAPLLLLRNLGRVGEVLETRAHVEALPDIVELDPERCYLSWTVRLATDRDEDGIRDVFTFVQDSSRIEVRPLEDPVPAAGAQPAASEAPPPVALSQAPRLAVAPTPPRFASQAVPRFAIQPAPRFPLSDAPPRMAGSDIPPSFAAGRGQPAASFRVSTEKVDKLIDLVGELVIAQSMIVAAMGEVGEASAPRLTEAVAEMERNTRELQERVMSMRMVPIKSIFGRFPRIVRDMSAACGKKVVLQTLGEETEIDKMVVEQIADPLTHLLRNAVDHGIERAEDRVLAGKDETGTITMMACHQGGNVNIEISDDGAGLDAGRIRQKALAMGMIAEGDTLTDDQIHGLILLPGFSTAATVTDISGRGVGMDVVKRNVEQLNGSLSLESRPGEGCRFRIKLPLTLAIIDGLTLRIGDQIFVVPLVSIVESFRPTAAVVSRVMFRGEVVRFRAESVPLVRLHELWGIEGAETDPTRALVVIVETASSRIGLLVDEVLEQPQVVVKSLGRQETRVEGVMGATILGDGKVALILDVPGLGRLACGDTGARPPPVFARGADVAPCS